MARPVDYNETVYEVPTTRTVRTFIPKIQVREVVKTIPSLDTQWEEEKVEVPHKKIIDKYVEVPMVSGTEVKYVPKVEVRERIIETSKPEVKWVEKLIEVPQVKEVVRYIESNSNIETVIRYVAKGSLEKPVERRAEEAPPMEETRRALLTPRLTVPISVSQCAQCRDVGVADLFVALNKSYNCYIFSFYFSGSESVVSLSTHVSLSACTFLIAFLSF